jgi:hypothetical protein
VVAAGLVVVGVPIALVALRRIKTPPEPAAETTDAPQLQPA